MGSGVVFTIRKLLIYLLLMGILCAYLGTLIATPAHAAIGTNQQLNFQGRLLNNKERPFPMVTTILSLKFIRTVTVKAPATPPGHRLVL